MACMAMESWYFQYWSSRTQLVKQNLTFANQPLNICCLVVGDVIIEFTSLTSRSTVWMTSTRCIDDLYDVFVRILVHRYLTPNVFSYSATASACPFFQNRIARCERMAISLDSSA